MDNEKLDLSSLDLRRNSKHWEALVRSVTERALHAHRKPLTVARQVTLWARPALAVAAALMLLCWSGALLHSHSTVTSRQPTQQQPEYTLLSWASESETPATTDILQVFGDDLGNR